MANLTSAEIKEKIMARESFWVGSVGERVTASRIANILGIKYRTGSDDGGGFYILYIPKLAKTGKQRAF